MSKTSIILFVLLLLTLAILFGLITVNTENIDILNPFNSLMLLGDTNGA